jgi:hypothetical protein
MQIALLSCGFAQILSCYTYDIGIQRLCGVFITSPVSRRVERDVVDGSVASANNICSIFLWMKTC